MEDPTRFLGGLSGRRVVLDEIHRLPNPSELLKLAADHHPETKIVATGSSTLAATKKFSDALTGRKYEVCLTPMTAEDLEAFGGTLEDRLWWGGLPPFFLSGEDTPGGDFQEWMDSYWARDIQEMFRVQQRASFLRFVELVLVNSGGLFEASSYAAPCEVSRPTVANYLSILEITRVADVLRPYSTRKASEIVATPKVYAFDTGFVRFYRGWEDRRPEDFGVLWEHYVLNEIRACLPEVEVRHWRDKRHREIDLVVLKHGRPPIAVECKWSRSTSSGLDGLAAFRRSYPEGASFVVTADTDRAQAGRVGETDFEWVGLRDLIDRISRI